MEKLSLSYMVELLIFMIQALNQNYFMELTYKSNYFFVQLPQVSGTILKANLLFGKSNLFPRETHSVKIFKMTALQWINIFTEYM